MKERIGIFGGTFNPIHVGHLLAARAAKEALKLDRLHFVPSARPALKSPGRLLPGSLRLGLLRLSLKGFHGASVLLDEGIERLRPFAPSCHGVDVAALIADATAARERLASLGAERMREVDVNAIAPRIRLSE